MRMYLNVSRSKSLHRKCSCQLAVAVGQYTESLDAVLKHDSRRISKIISCVGYTSSSAVQLEAIKLTRVFAARQPHLVDMLVQQRVKVTPDGTHGRQVAMKC